MKRWLHVTLYGSAAAAVAALACYALGVIGGDRLQPAEALACGSDFSFTGTLRNGLFDGEGEIFYEDGGHYAGGFMAGRFGGAGIYTSPEGWRYEGVFAAGEPSGDGVIWLDEESSVTVTAENVADILSRKGWEYRGGLGERGQTGEGRFLFSTGESYTGGFLLGLAEGQGTYAGANGKPVYEGEWKAGLFHGQGRYLSPDGKFSYEGMFEAGLPHGQAEYKEGGALRYSGGFVQGVAEGEGAYHSLEGWLYEGGFKDGAFHGKGRLTKAGKTTDGTWEKGKQLRENTNQMV